MTLSGLNVTRRDGGLGVPSVAGTRFLYVLAATGATATALTPNVAISQTARAIGTGYGIDAVCHKLDTDGGIVDVLASAASVAASNSAVTASGGGPTVTIAGDSPYALDAVIAIVLGGALGTATWKYTLDGGETYSGVLTVPTGGTFLIPGTGITVTFPSGTYVATETYSFTTTPAEPNATDLEAAFATALASSREWDCIVWLCNPAAGSDAATLGAAIDALHADLENTGRYSQAIMAAGNEPRATVVADWDGVDTSYVHVVHGMVPIKLGTGLSGYRNPKMPYLAEFARIAALVKASTNPGWVGLEDPGKSKIGTPDEDEFSDGEVLTPYKIIGPRTYPGEGATIYPSDSFTKSADGSDFTGLQRGRVMDVFSRVARNKMMPYVNSTLRVVPDGTGNLAPEEAAIIDGLVHDELDRVIMKADTDDGKKGYASAVAFAVDQTNDFLTTKTLQASGGCVPLGDGKYISVSVGFMRSV